MFGAKLTLIVLTSQRLARIDLAGPRGQLRVERSLSCPAIPASELAAAVAIAYRMGEPGGNTTTLRAPKPNGQRSVIVLSDDIWNDTLTLPLDVTVLLQPDELRQALAIEAENYSGLSAFDSRLASRQLVDTSSHLIDASSNSIDASSNSPAANSWWVAQVSNRDLASMLAATTACGVRFLGATHAQAWWRVNRSQLPSLENLADQAVLLQFGQQWAEALSQDAFDLIIRPQTLGSQRTSLAWLQTSAALATALVCAGAYQLRSAQWKSAESQLKQLQQTLSEYDNTAGKLRAAENKLQQARQKLSLAERAAASTVLITKPSTSQLVDTPNWLALFDALAIHTPDDCWIENWHAADHTTTLVGRAASAQPIHELASRLEQALPSSQWTIEPPVLRQEENQLLHFELPLHSQTEQQATKTAKGGVQ